MRGGTRIDADDARRKAHEEAERAEALELFELQIDKLGSWISLARLFLVFTHVILKVHVCTCTLFIFMQSIQRMRGGKAPQVPFVLYDCILHSMIKSFPIPIYTKIKV